MPEMQQPVVGQAEVEYREVEGFPGYRVNAAGDLQSCRNHHGIITGEWHKINPSPNKDGYCQVNLWCLGNPKCRRIHTLVLTAFAGPCPEGMQACHIDGNRQNNRIENLRWGTIQENIDDRERHGNTARGERHGNAKLNRELVEEAKRLRLAGWTFIKIARHVKISKRQVMRVIKGEAWLK